MNTGTSKSQSSKRHGSTAAVLLLTSLAILGGPLHAQTNTDVPNSYSFFPLGFSLKKNDVAPWRPRASDKEDMAAAIASTIGLDVMNRERALKYLGVKQMWNQRDLPNPNFGNLAAVGIVDRFVKSGLTLLDAEVLHDRLGKVASIEEALDKAKEVVIPLKHNSTVGVQLGEWKPVTRSDDVERLVSQGSPLVLRTARVHSALVGYQRNAWVIVSLTAGHSIATRREPVAAYQITEYTVRNIQTGASLSEPDVAQAIKVSLQNQPKAEAAELARRLAQPATTSGANSALVTAGTYFGNLTGKSLKTKDGRYFDLHLVHLQGGQNYRIAMFPTANQFPPTITVEDFQGAKLRVGGDNIGFAAPRTGLYRVLALADQPGKTGSYRLTFSPKAEMPAYYEVQVTDVEVSENANFYGKIHISREVDGKTESTPVFNRTDAGGSRVVATANKKTPLELQPIRIPIIGRPPEAVVKATVTAELKLWKGILTAVDFGTIQGTQTVSEIDAARANEWIPASISTKSKNYNGAATVTVHYRVRRMVP